MAGQSLKDKTVHGSIWSGIDNMTQFAVSFVVSIVLARLLTPDDYGLIGIIAIFTTVCNVLINGGFTSALIRKKNVSSDDYNTAFIVNLIMSFLLYLAIFLSAPLIAKFFGREELVSLTRVSTLSMIIGALALVQQTRLTKRIDFRTQTRITIVSCMTGGVIGIAMALLGYGVWSLVAQSLSSQCVRTFLLWIFNKWFPNFTFSKNSFRDMFGYGWKIMAVGLLNSIWTELYQVVVGRFYAPAVLGQYTRAKQFAQLFSSNFTTVVQRVTFPVLSNIQDEKERLIAAYRRIIKTTMFITAVCMFALGAVSEPLIYCLIGEKWHDASIYLPFICISSSLFPLNAINLNMLEVQGRSGLFLGIEVLKKLIALLPLYIGATVGILPMLWVNIATSFVSFILNSFFTGKLLGYSSWMQIKDILPSYGVALTVALSVYFLKYLSVSNWLILPLQIMIGISVFFLVCEVTAFPEYEDSKEMVKPFINRLKKALATRNK